MLQQERADGSVGTLTRRPRDCQPYCHSTHPFQQESCQEQGARTALAKGMCQIKVAELHWSGHADVFIAFLCSQGAGRAPRRPMVKEQMGWRYLPRQAGHGAEKVQSKGHGRFSASKHCSVGITRGYPCGWSWDCQGMFNLAKANSGLDATWKATLARRNMLY